MMRNRRNIVAAIHDIQQRKGGATENNGVEHEIALWGDDGIQMRGQFFWVRVLLEVVLVWQVDQPIRSARCAYQYKNR